VGPAQMRARGMVTPVRRRLQQTLVQTEGERTRGRTEDARAELLWDRIVTRCGACNWGRDRTFGAGPPRRWAAIGVQGLAPQWFDVEATIYGRRWRAHGRAIAGAIRAVVSRSALVLQPELEMNLYGKGDPQRGLGSGLSDMELALRLRYEIRREFAPYIGVTWNRAFGATADSDVRTARVSAMHAWSRACAPGSDNQTPLPTTTWAWVTQ